MSWNEILAEYDQSREWLTDTSVLCHAPFVSLNFEQNGRVTACCYNRSFVLGAYPEQSVSEIWSGASARALREAFLRNEEAPGCDLCFHQLKSRNFGGALMRNFDQYARHAGYRPELAVSAPRLLEFEISNTCNLECIMCSGYWSSSIRANREKLPPLRSPYDGAFVDQLEEFLPGLAGAKFLGGEPFLIERYYDIWERFRRSNPKAELAITTNATILPRRARELLEGLRAYFAVSLDAFSPATYEAIRTNARFSEVMANVEYLLDYTRRRGTALSIAICPMTYNWRELPALLEFCESRRLALHFNMVLRPAEASLASLAAAQLTEVIETLDRVRPSGRGAWGKKNRRHWQGLVNQLRGWCEEKLRFDRSCRDEEARLRAFAARARGSAQGPAVPESLDRLIPPAVLSLRLAEEQANGNAGELSTFLPPKPTAMAGDGERPSTIDLLLVAHLLCSFVRDRQAGIDDGDSALLEQQRLRDYIARRGHSDPAWLSELGHWLEERLLDGKTVLLIPWMTGLLDSPENQDAWQRALQKGLARLNSDGLESSEYRTVAAYFDRLVAGFFPHHPHRRTLDESPSALVTPIPDLVHLRRVLDALYLFHCCYEPDEDHEEFRRRLDGCAALLAESGKGEAACRSLGAADPVNVYRAVAHASAEDLRRNLEFLR
jgi:MoaA/NifB/PqqE/SkfB family radical SAM enzyme